MVADRSFPSVNGSIVIPVPAVIVIVIIVFVLVAVVVMATTSRPNVPNLRPA